MHDAAYTAFRVDEQFPGLVFQPLRGVREKPLQGIPRESHQEQCRPARLHGLHGRLEARRLHVLDECRRISDLEVWEDLSHDLMRQ